MKCLIFVCLLLSGCSFQVENPFRENTIPKAQDIIAAVNALSQAAVKADERLKALELKNKNVTPNK